MKTIKGFFLLALMAVLFFAFNGCGDGSSEKRSNVITENDLFANPQIKTTHEDTMVIFLEHPDGEGHDNNIGVKGVDEVPVYYSEDINYTFCWEDDTSAAGHSMELLDITGNAVFHEDINIGECANATITAGHYTMRFTHGGQSQSEGTHTIFIRPVEDISNSRGIVNVSYNSSSELNMLLTTNSCRGCDLSYANLIGVDLSEANLYRADLYRAMLTGANLTKANLNMAKLILANLSYANLTKANLTGADLYKAKLTKANLTRADLTGANMDSAILDYATWVDGTICAEGSIGTCL